MNQRTRFLGPLVVVGMLMSTGSSLAADAPQPPASSTPAFQDPLDLQAPLYSHASTRPLMGVAQAGSRLVAVGMRGLIIVSEDQGKTWKQSQVPVQTDLLAVQFPTPDQGWVVGHNGVILHSQDGGQTWSKQLDGIAAGQLFEKYYKAKADGGDAAAQSLLTSIKLDFQDGPTLPFLDVWFESPQKGFVVGSFGLIAATEDGGRTWAPALEHVENPELFNLNSIAKTPSGIFIAGEHGMVYKYDEAANTFRRQQTGYTGSLFGVTGSGKAVLAFGLRGSVYRSLDAGATWHPLDSGTPASVIAGTYDEKSKSFTLATEAGQIIIGDEGAAQLHPIAAAPGAVLTSLVHLDGNTRCLVGVSGARLWTGP